MTEGGGKGGERGKDRMEEDSMNKEVDKSIE